ncbi:hypothetical protein [Microbulbifer spongiae]|uniref:Uncharacterized protein n=1 Tax=Microbulbifer spongiae TaxID=2944933 RepID=A0ABY9E9P9_9GAMM|nr:hypothetical protein [Microbulbifer sp. MI-G]WKD48862.1 hypothetical protein M8T91_13240 [Microbulbifer sp. MI-G]
MHNLWLLDLMLGLTALLLANQYWYLTRAQFQSAALMLVAALAFIALAAIAGAYRYGIDPGVTELHRALTRLSGYAAFLLIGIGLLWVRLGLRWGADSRAPAYVVVAVVLASSISLGESGLLAPRWVVDLYSTLGLLLWLLVALLEWVSPRRLSRKQAFVLGGGAVLVAVNVLFVGTGARQLLGLARTNWFHLLLAISVFSLLSARPLFTRTADGRRA